MLRQCLLKEVQIEPIPMKLSVANAAKMKYSDETFDTLVCTFGLGSFENPVETLKEMKRVLKTGGKMLLVETGLAKYSYIRKYQEKNAIRHVSRHGSWYNREIQNIVRESGLQVDDLRTRQLGSLHVMICSKVDENEENIDNVTDSETVLTNNETDIKSTEIVSSDSENISADSKTVPAGSKTVSGDSKTVSADSKTVSGDSKTVSADSKTVSADSKTVLGDSKTVLGESKTVSEGSKTVSTNSKTVVTVSTENETVSADCINVFKDSKTYL
eukprot:GHVL01001452.1.p1 GENE.GHVL01001452.1~~GHVL01001452.1.p1  ORF type:complete len:272 (-),score=72.71 GHVL01001452.1:905-1720(-)